VSATFLPDRLRPRAVRRSSRRRYLVLAILPVAVAVLPWWRVRAVELNSCAGLPDSIARSMEALVGRSALAVSPQWVRHQLEVWPAVASVEVQLDLPGTLRVSATPATARGSLAVGRGWHAVTADGAVGGSVETPVEPVLEGFACRADELRRGLEVARRLAEASGGSVEAVRSITPADFQLRLRVPSGGGPVLVHVAPGATVGERYWCERVKRGERPAPWSDLRWDDRVVVGGVG
jgi:hypothetical protein